MLKCKKNSKALELFWRFGKKDMSFLLLVHQELNKHFTSIKNYINLMTHNKIDYSTSDNTVIFNV